MARASPTSGGSEDPPYTSGTSEDVPYTVVGRTFRCASVVGRSFSCASVVGRSFSCASVQGDLQLRLAFNPMLRSNSSHVYRLDPQNGYCITSVTRLLRSGFSRMYHTTSSV